MSVEHELYLLYGAFVCIGLFTRIRMKLKITLICGFFCLAWTGLCRSDVQFNIAIAEDGHYLLRFEDLKSIDGPIVSRRLGLFEKGVRIPLVVDDGGDGFIGPGDTLRFDGRRLEGTRSWYNEYSRFNIYQLRAGVEPADQYLPVKNSPVTQGVLQHLEKDVFRIALTRAVDPVAADSWYWHRISSLSEDGFQFNLPIVTKPQSIRVYLAGLSGDKNAKAAEMPQHHVEILLNGSKIGQARWDGQEAFIFDSHVANIPWQLNGKDRIQIKIPRRFVEDGRVEVADVVLLNWIELIYPAGVVPENATIPAREGAFRLFVGDAFQKPAWVAATKTYRSLRDTMRRADYIFITHPALEDAILPLARYHEASGLKVEVVDVQQIYDEFNYGIKSPYAIREFLRFAWQQWGAPAPRFVLLAGDASWGRTPERDDNRDLVPTLHVLAQDQLAASDNGLVTISGDDWRPDIAIGRLPAATPLEMEGMVDKILAYARNPQPGEWRNRVTFVSDMNPGFQRISNEIATGLEKMGLTAIRVFPLPSVARRGEDQQRLIDAMNAGGLLVHFIGHGGRFVWRTGPADLAGATDLFKLEDLDKLEQNRRLPLILSMTCSSGPFDHPTADSIAEGFLRAPRRGAIGVVAASWRVGASANFSSLLVRELVNPKNRIGEAVLKAKQSEPNRNLVESYNLLGDPALHLSLPPGPMF